MIFLPHTKLFSRRGFTALETVVALGIGSLVIGAISLFFGRVVTVNRQDYEQILITEDARIQMIRISDAIRNAGRSAVAGAWLEAAAANSLTVYTNTDSDPEMEKITFFLSDTELQQTTTESDASTETRVLTRNIRNVEEEVNLFTLYDVAGKVVDYADATSQNVNRIGLRILVDVDSDQLPEAAVIETSAFPRGIVEAGEDAGGRLWPVSINYPFDPDTNAYARVEITNPQTSEADPIVWPISMINVRLSTYVQHYKVNINYQDTTQGSFLPGWYAWIGPIFVGQSGSQKYYVTDQVPINELCLGQTFDQALTDCQLRTVTAGLFSVSYRPIVMYDYNGHQDYLGETFFTYDPPYIPIPQLVYYKLDEGNSNTAGDSSGNGYVGTLYQGLGSSWPADRPSVLSTTSTYSLDFDGHNDYIGLPNNLALDGSPTFNMTFSVWVKLTGSDLYEVLSAGNDTDGYQLRINNGNIDLVMGANGNVFNFPINPLVNNGQWRHIALTIKKTFNSSGQSTTGKIFVDGVNRGVAGTGTGVIVPGYTGPKRIGGSIDGENFYEGRMDDIRFYNQVLTDAQIQQLAQGQNP
jgi:hypothetical protein